MLRAALETLTVSRKPTKGPDGRGASRSTRTLPSAVPTGDSGPGGDFLLLHNALAGGRRAAGNTGRRDADRKQAQSRCEAVARGNWGVLADRRGYAPRGPAKTTWQIAAKRIARP